MQISTFMILFAQLWPLSLYNQLITQKKCKLNTFERFDTHMCIWWPLSGEEVNENSLIYSFFVCSLLLLMKLLDCPTKCGHIKSILILRRFALQLAHFNTIDSMKFQFCVRRVALSHAIIIFFSTWLHQNIADPHLESKSCTCITQSLNLANEEK